MATKKKITDDWQQLFPELKKTKLLEMDNRLGPLITGIYLKVVRNTYYTQALIELEGDVSQDGIDSCYSKLALNNDYEAFWDKLYSYADKNMKQ